MPDLGRLKDFLERTQRAMQTSVDNGDQQGVDQYENFLDRATAVAERHLGQQGPAGQEGPQGLAGLAPKPQQDAPQLMAGDDPGPQNGPFKTLVGGAESLGQDRDGETSNPFTLAGVGKPNSALNTMVNGVPNAPKTNAKADRSTYPAFTPPTAPPMTGGRVKWHLPAMRDLPVIGPPLMAYDALMATPAAQSAAQGVQDIGEELDPSLKANLGKPYVKPDDEFVKPDQYPAYPGTAQPNDPEVKISLDDALKNTSANPDIQAELAKLKAQLGDKPHFFTLENLAMLLLMGAPRAYGHFKGELHDWKKSNMAIDQMGLQYQFGKAGDKNKQLNHDADLKQKREATAAGLLPHIVTAKQKPVLDQMNALKGEMNTIIQANPGFQFKEGDPITIRLQALQQKYEDLKDTADDIAGQSYDKGYQPKKK